MVKGAGGGSVPCCYFYGGELDACRRWIQYSMGLCVVLALLCCNTTAPSPARTSLPHARPAHMAEHDRHFLPCRWAERTDTKTYFSSITYYCSSGALSGWNTMKLHPSLSSPYGTRFPRRAALTMTDNIAAICYGRSKGAKITIGGRALVIGGRSTL
jgi:hypothetical protein